MFSRKGAQRIKALHFHSENVGGSHFKKLHFYAQN